MSADDVNTTLRRDQEGQLLVAHPSPLRGREHTESTDPLLGNVIDNRYLIHRLAGTGGMANVYLGTHAVTGVKLAVKVVDVKKRRNLKLRDRLLQEARLAMELTSNYVARAYDVGALPDGRLYIIQEYLEGEDLEAVIAREGPLPWMRAASMALDVCGGLSAAHRLGIIHRDVKPGNCFRTTTDGNPDHVKIIDFGIARDERDEVGLTQQGILLGTPEYTAPEMVVHGIKANAQTDVYALGVTLYKLLTGTTPFRGNDDYEVLQQHIHQCVTLPSREAPHLGIPPEADAIVAKALEKEPARRFASAEEMAAAIREALAPPRPAELTAEFAPPTLHPAEPTVEPPLPQHDDREAIVELGAMEAEPAPPPLHPGPPSPNFSEPVVAIADAGQAIYPPSARAIDVRVTLNRGVTLLLLASFFVIGTWVVIPVVPDEPSPLNESPPSSSASEADRVPTDSPLAQPSPLTHIQAQLPAPAEPVSAQEPASVSPSSAVAPLEGEHVPAQAPVPGPTTPTSVSERDPLPQPTPARPPVPEAEPPGPGPTGAPTPSAPSEADPDFDYQAAKRLIADEHTYLRNICMNKGTKPLAKLKMRVDVRPGGKATIKIMVSAPDAVRDCVHGDLSFPFAASPRGGAFIYTLTAKSASIEPVPLASSPVK